MGRAQAGPRPDRALGQMNAVRRAGQGEVRVGADQQNQPAIPCDRLEPPGDSERVRGAERAIDDPGAGGKAGRDGFRLRRPRRVGEEQQARQGLLARQTG